VYTNIMSQDIEMALSLQLEACCVHQHNVSRHCDGFAELSDKWCGCGVHQKGTRAHGRVPEHTQMANRASTAPVQPAAVPLSVSTSHQACAPSQSATGAGILQRA
jgi:hypothetical protein